MEFYRSKVSLHHQVNPYFKIHATNTMASVGVICACLPTLRPLFNKLLQKGGFDSWTTTHTHRSRVQRTADDFERLYDCQLGNMSPSVNSKTAIVITHKVEQERGVGKLSTQSTEQQMWSKCSAGQ